MKNLYVILDTVSQEVGEILSFANDGEAKRSFVYACSSTPTYKDLELHYLGTLDFVYVAIAQDADEKSIFCPELRPFADPFGSEVKTNVICTGYEVQEEVQKIIEDNLLKVKMQNSISSMFHSKEFVDNVQKLCRYFSKNDKKRFR